MFGGFRRDLSIDAIMFWISPEELESNETNSTDPVDIENKSGK